MSHEWHGTYPPYPATPHQPTILQQRQPQPPTETAQQQTERVHKMVADIKIAEANRRQIKEAQQQAASLETRLDSALAYIAEIDGPPPQGDTHHRRPPKPQVHIIRKPPPKVTTYRR